MNIGVPSRFACLKIEDDDNRPQNTKSKEIKKKIDFKVIPKKPNLNVQSDKIVKSRKLVNDKQNTQNINKRKKNANTEQWEQWKVKDNEMINGTYEQDLQNAIMLSKLEYEHNKEMYTKNREMNGKTSNQSQIKKKKKKAMSINEFLSSGMNKQNLNTDNNVKPENDVEKKHFFEEIKNATKQELNKEEVKENRKKREANIDNIITLAQCQEKLQEERGKRFALQLELDKIKAEIITVKERNKTLCGILGHGEMKDKADVLVELEKLYSEKNDLTEEVTRLHVLLEQERSKVATLTSDSHNNKHKEKKRKQKGI